MPAHPDRRARAGHGGAGRMPLYGRYGSRPRRPARTAPRPWGACPCGSSPGCGGIRLRSREKGGPDGPSDRIRPAGGELGAPLSTGYPDPSRVQPPPVGHPVPADHRAAPGSAHGVTLRHGRRPRRRQETANRSVPCWTAQQTTELSSDVNHAPITRNTKFLQLVQASRAATGVPVPAKPKNHAINRYEHAIRARRFGR